MKNNETRKTKSKVGKKIVLGLIGVVFIILIVTYVMFAERLHAALSVRKLQDTLYCIEYKGDYGFEKFLEQGGAESNSKMADYIIKYLSNGFYKKDNSSIDKRTFGCSTLKAQNEDGAFIYGRNFDWEPCDTMIVHTIPKDGYESVSTCCMNFMGFGDGWLPEGFANQFISISSIYAPMDGMNEKGVIIADLMAGDRVETHQDTDKPDIVTTPAIRLVLDHAANVDEAVELLSQYDMNSAIESAHHFYIADANGKSIDVEYVDNEMVVVETNELTNHYLAPAKAGIGNQNSHDRFDQLTNAYEASNGKMTMEELTKQLQGVSCGMLPDETDPTEKSDWTCCYNTKDLTVDFYYMENYNQKYSITLGKGKNWISDLEIMK